MEYDQYQHIKKKIKVFYKEQFPSKLEIGKKVHENLIKSAENKDGSQIIVVKVGFNTLNQA